MEKVLVAYFSASGTTAQKAKEIAKAVGSDLYEIRPEVPYTSDDLDFPELRGLPGKHLHFGQ